MKQSESIAHLAVALVAAQADIRGVEKSATNPHFKSKYATLDAIIAMTRPALYAHDLAITQSAGPSDDGKGLVVETRLTHASGEWIENAVYIPLAKMDPQGAGAGVTYGRRFGLSALLSIASDEDDDGNNASRPAGVRATRPARAPSDAPPVKASEKVYNPPPKFVGLAKDRPMPFGKTKGTPLGKLPKEELESVAKWAAGRPGFEPFLKDVRYVLADIALNVDVRPTPNSDELMARVHASIEKDEEPLTALLGP